MNWAKHRKQRQEAIELGSRNGRMQEQRMNSVSVWRKWLFGHILDKLGKGGFRNWPWHDKCNSISRAARNIALVFLLLTARYTQNLTFFTWNKVTDFVDCRMLCWNWSVPASSLLFETSDPKLKRWSWREFYFGFKLARGFVQSRQVVNYVWLELDAEHVPHINCSILYLGICLAEQSIHLGALTLL